MHIEETIRSFLASSLGADTVAGLGRDTSLQRTGLVDSSAVLHVVAFLEGEFRIEVADCEVAPENLDTIARMAAFVERKRGAR